MMNSTLLASPLSLAHDQSVTDEYIVNRVLHGETDWFEVLMRRHNQRLFRLIRSIVRNDHDAEDVLQEAYLRAFKYLPSFEGRSSFATWLARIALYEALGIRRKAARVSLVAHKEETEAPGESATIHPFLDPEDSASNNELAEALEAAIDSLPSSYRTVFVLRHVEGLDTSETAASLDLGEEAIKSRLHRARSMLKKRLGKRLHSDFSHVHRFLGPNCDRVVQNVLARISAAGPESGTVPASS